MHLTMTKKSGLFLLLILMASVLAFLSIKDTYDEKQLTTCIDEIIISQQIKDIQVTTKNRGGKPILKGFLTQTKKNKLINSINNQCQVTEIQDFIGTIESSKAIASSLNFKIDYVNNILYISGLVKSQQQIDNILDSFKTAIKGNFPPSNLDWTLSPDLSADANAQAIDYAIYITLLFTVIDNIKLADITIESNRIILKGLVRDTIRENETLSGIRKLFDDEFTIDNQLELVIKFKPDIQGIEFEKIDPPIFTNPNDN